MKYFSFTLVQTLLAQATTNPYAGSSGFVNDIYKQQVDSSIQKDPSIAAAAEIVKKQSTALWLASMGDLTKLGMIQQASQQATPQNPIVMTFVVYNIPNRDCSSEASAGGAKDLQDYQDNYIGKIVQAIKGSTNPNLKFSLVIEPDLFPNLITNNNQGHPKCMDFFKKGYIEGIPYAVAQLSTLANTFVYMDGGNAGWLGSEAFSEAYANMMADILKKAKALNPNSKITGFTTGVSNYEPYDSKGIAMATQDCPASAIETKDGLSTCKGVTIDAKGYIKRLGDFLEAADLPARFIVDTSRAGQSAIKQTTGQWCNPKGAGLGPLPVAEPPFPRVDAFVWVKTPGESDGGSIQGQGYDPVCDPSVQNGIPMVNAPAAGQWFHDQFVALIQQANPKIGSANPNAIANQGQGNIKPASVSITSSTKQDICTDGGQALPVSVTITSLSKEPFPSTASLPIVPSIVISAPSPVTSTTTLEEKCVETEVISASSQASPNSTQEEDCEEEGQVAPQSASSSQEEEECEDEQVDGQAQITPTSSSQSSPIASLPLMNQNSSTFLKTHSNGIVTSFLQGPYKTQHCLGNTQAIQKYTQNLPGGLENPLSKNAGQQGLWVSLSANNVGRENWENCGKCIKLTVSIKKPSMGINIKKTIGPLIVADVCSNCDDNHVDLTSQAYSALGITSRTVIEPLNTDSGSTEMASDWTPVDCNSPFSII